MYHIQLSSGKCIYMYVLGPHVYTFPELYIMTCLNHVCTIALSEDRMYMVQTCMYMSDTRSSMSGPGHPRV